MQHNRKVRPEILDSVALLVVDAQDSFIDTLHNKEAFLQRAAFAIEAARCLKLRTLFTEQAPEKLGHTNKELLKLARKPTVFAKQSFSALNAPGIARYLREKEIYNLLIVGLEVPVCIYQTGLQATDEDIDATFLTDCLGSRHPQDEAPVLAALTAMGCSALPSETVFYSLLSDTQNPYFRPFTEIVKAFSSKEFSLSKYLENRVEEVNEAPEPPQKRSEGVPSEPAEEDREYKRQPKEETGDDSQRQRRRGRRRGRNRGRDRQEQSESSPKPEPSAKPQDPAPKKPEPSPKPEPAPSAEAAASKEPAKKAAKRPAKKAAKKAAKKVAKKAAKKVAEKSAE